MITRGHRRLWAALTAFLAFLMVSHGYSQPPAGTVPSPSTGSPRTPPAGVPIAPAIVPSVPITAYQVSPPTPVAPPTVEQLIEKLETVQKQKAELEKQEKALGEQLQEALQKQKERLTKLGIEKAAPKAVPPKPVPDDVPRLPPPALPDSNR